MFKLCGLLLMGVLTVFASLSIAVTGQVKGSASVSGRITVGGKPAKGITIIATPSDKTYPPKPFSASATTDDEGRYRISGLTAGTYKITPYDPTNFVPARNAWESPGKDLTLGANETADNIDFEIAKGGVITGRITNSEGKPLIETLVTIETLDSKVVVNHRFDNSMYQTDDRGIYRIYGLPAGQYLVSVGEDKDSGNLTFGIEKNGFYPKTFYPGVTDKSQAKTVEIGEGGEEKDIDIVLGPREKTYTISGRVTDETTGKMVPGVQLGYGILSPDGRSFGSSGSGSSMISDAAGEFKLAGIKPGRYAVFATKNSQDNTNNDRTSNTVTVEITDTDVSDIEIKTRPGISIDGFAVLEGVSDPQIISKLQQVRIYGFTSTGDAIAPPNYQNATIQSNNSFHLGGLSPGKFMVRIGTYVFTLRRVEQNGVASPDNSVDLTQGSSVTNVRLVLSYGTSVIRGQAVFPGGNIPSGLDIFVFAYVAGQNLSSDHGVQADARGRFVIENLSAGEYQVQVLAYASPSPPNRAFSGGQTVTVANNSEANVTITLAPYQPKSGGDRP